LTDIPKHFEQIFITDKQSKLIHWIFLNNNKEKTIFYFHGNSWPISSYIEEIQELAKLWYNVMSFDYPWYWKSTWYPTEENIYNAMEVFYEHMRSTRWECIDHPIVFGHSIWSAIWAEFASKRNIEKLILLSPLASKYAVCKSRYWVVFQKFLFMKNGFDSLSKVKDIYSPILIIHGNDDKIISFQHGKNIFEQSASVNKFLIILDKYWHSWIFSSFKEVLNPLYAEFLKNWKLKEPIITLVLWR
jgi:pimeloyl-ACP methyl ester carboxylesterase